MLKRAFHVVAVIGFFTLLVGSIQQQGTEFRRDVTAESGTDTAAKSELSLISPAFAQGGGGGPPGGGGPNTAPEAEAGVAQTAAIGDTVVLYAGGSIDADGDLLTPSWQLVTVPAGSLAVLSDPAAVRPTFAVDLAGDYVAELVVNDGTVDSAADAVTISTVNSTPVAQAGRDQAISLGATAHLDGSASSDFDGDRLSYSWTLVATPVGSTAALSDPNDIFPTFVADLAGDYVADLIVSDGTISSVADAVLISTGNLPPVADGGFDQDDVTFGGTVLDAEKTIDANGDQLSFLWSIAFQNPEAAAAMGDEDLRRARLSFSRVGDYVVQVTVDDGTATVQWDTVLVTTDNVPPVADAGPDQPIVVGDTVTLDGSDSSDFHGDPLSFTWALIAAPAGSSASLSDSGAVRPGFQADLAGIYIAQLRVNDGTEWSRPDTVIIRTGNVAPIADAGPDQTLGSSPTTGFLDGSGSFDADLDTLTYDWALTDLPARSDAVISDPTAVSPSFERDQPGTYMAQLTVNDGTLNGAPDTIIVSAKNRGGTSDTNSRPVAVAGPDQLVLPGAMVQLDASASSDADGHTITYRWAITSKPAGSGATLNSPTAVNPSFTVDILGTYLVQLIVKDDQLDSEPDTLVIEPLNNAPSADAGPDQAVTAGDLVTLDGSGSSDPDLDPLIYSWSLVTQPAGSTATLSDPAIVNPTFTPDKPGTYVAELIVNDGLAGSAPDQVTITAANRPPVADAGPDQAVTAGNPVQLDGSGSFDADDDPITYAWSLISRPGDSTAILSDPSIVNPSLVTDAPGSYVAELIVDDGTAPSVADQVTITANPVTGTNSAPVLAAIGNLSVDLGATLTLDLAATDVNGDTLAFSASPLPLPDGASLNGATGFFSFTPDATQVGNIALAFIVSDGLATDSESVTITVVGAPGGGVTALAARLLDANDADNGITTALVGATVWLLGDSVTTVTDANGDFLLSGIPSGGQVFAVDSSTANLAPDGSKYASFREELTLIAEVTNEIARPIYLPRIDPAGIAFYDADGTTTTMVINAPLGVTLEVPPDTAFEEGGAIEFNGEISISEVPLAFAPMPLPAEFQPAMLISIQPTGVVFSQPLAITFPNLDNLPAGSELDIYSLDAEAGSFKVVGVGTVSADGSTIETTSGGIIGASWHFPLGPQLGTAVNALANAVNMFGAGIGALADAARNLFGSGEDNPDTCGQNVGSSTAVCSGGLGVAHALPSHRSLGQSRALAFAYDSTSADPRPVVPADATIPVRSAVPNTVSARLSVAGVTQGGEVFTSTAGLSESVDETLLQAVQFDAAGFATGSYPYSLMVTNNFDISSVGSFQTGKVLVNNESASPFGAGWTLDGLERLRIQNNGDAVLTRGDGSASRFRPATRTTVFSDDFEAGARAEWSTAATTLTPIGARRFLGQFARTTAGLTLNGLPPHGEVVLSFDLYVIKTWDGNHATHGPDVWRVAVAGGQTLLNTTFTTSFDIWTPAQAYPDNHPGGSNPPETGAVEIGTLGYTHFFNGTTQTADSVYRITFTFPHTDASATLNFSGLMSGVNDEFWGLDNVIVETIPVGGEPGPGSVVAFTAPPGNFSELLQNLDGTFTRTLKNGTVIEYDANGFITARIDRNGNATSYAYDGGGLLTTITDPAGLATTLAYTGGLLTGVTDPAARVTGFEHDGDGNLTKITDPDLSTRLFAYDARHRLTAQTSKRGHVTSYDYGPHGRLTQSNLPDGSTRQLAAAQVAGVIDVSAGLGSEANPAPLTRPEAVASAFTDGNGNTATTELDMFGAATRSEDALSRIITTERDENSKPTRSVAANGRVSEMTYDERGNLLTLTEAVGDALERVTAFTYEPDFNQITSIIDPRGNPTSFAYDGNGNLTTVTDAALTQTVMAYSDANCPGLATGVTRAVGLAEETTTTLAYDPVTCNLLTTTDDLGNPTTMAYDAAGNVVSVTDALLRESRFVYDGLNRVTQSIDATNTDPAPACGTAGVTCFALDAAGNLADLTDAGGEVTSFDYDQRDRVTDRTDPLLNAENYTYDGAGNLRFATDRKGQVIEFQYDLANRLVKKIMQPGEPEESLRDIGYDSVNNVTSVIDPDSSLAFTYDLLKRVETASTAGSPVQPAVVLTASYDANGNRLTLDDSLGQSAYVYDALNRLTDLTTPSLPAQPILYGYDVLSRRTDVSLPNGVDTSLTFDTASRLTDISHVLGGVTTVSSFAYGHNSVNDRTSLTQTRSAVSVTGALTYGYDDLDRLTSATHPQIAAPDETFGYDAVGNRLNRDGQVVDSVFDAANRLIEDDDFTYAYDLNGNLESKTAKAGGAVTDYTWDAENRLARIDLPGGGFADYVYDGIGRRIQKDANGAVTRYVYDGSDVLLEYDGSNFLLARYTHGAGIDDQVMVERDIDSSGSFDVAERFFYQTDGLGSVTELTDSTGAVARTLVYDSYGQIVQDTGGVAQPYAYTGRELDSESGLHYYRARYYDAATGRFLSEDPIGFGAGDANLYRYVFNSPVNLTDPDGKVIPLIIAEGLRRCALGGIIGGVAAANGAVFGKFGAGTKEKLERKNSDGDCSGSNEDPVLDAEETFLDIGTAVGLGALSGCAIGVFGDVSGASVGLAATSGAILGFARGFFGGPDIDLPFGF